MWGQFIENDRKCYVVNALVTVDEQTHTISRTLKFQTVHAQEAREVWNEVVFDM